MIYVKCDNLGNVMEVIEKNSIMSGWVDITNQEHSRQVGLFPERFFVENNQLFPKTKVTLMPEKLTVKADGVDVTKVKVNAEQKGLIQLKVGSREIQVDPGTELEISSDSIGIITVSVKDPKAWGPAISVFAEPVYAS